MLNIVEQLTEFPLRYLQSLGFPGGITWIQQSLGQEDPLEGGMATHSSILAWRIPMDRGAWWAAVHRVTRVGHDRVTYA